jgi:hypothetical protein
VRLCRSDSNQLRPEKPAAIGSEFAESEGKSIVDNLTITSCSITANKTQGAGIGSRHATSSGKSIVGNATISDGSKVNATGIEGAGRGSGYAGPKGTSAVWRLSIPEGDFTVATVNGSRTGSGCSYNGESAVSNLTIENVRVTAEGTTGAGIGPGYAECTGVSYVESLMMVGGTVLVKASDGAGIGSDRAVLGGFSNVTTLSIRNGTINIYTHNGPGSATNLGIAAVHELTIDGANITMTSCTGSGFANLTPFGNGMLK